MSQYAQYLIKRALGELTAPAQGFSADNPFVSHQQTQAPAQPSPSATLPPPAAGPAKQLGQQLGQQAPPAPAAAPAPSNWDTADTAVGVGSSFVPGAAADIGASGYGVYRGATDEQVQAPIAQDAMNRHGLDYATHALGTAAGYAAGYMPYGDTIASSLGLPGAQEAGKEIGTTAAVANDPDTWRGMQQQMAGGDPYAQMNQAALNWRAQRRPQPAPVR